MSSIGLISDHGFVQNVELRLCGRCISVNGLKTLVFQPKEDCLPCQSGIDAINYSVRSKRKV